MTVIAAGALLAPAAAAAAAKAQPSYVLTGQFCKANYVGRRVKVRKRVHHRLVITERAECVHVSRPTVTFYWCSPVPTNPQPYNINCSTDSSTKGDPPNPLKAQTGRQVSLDTMVEGTLQNDTFPNGYLTYAITGPPGGSYTASWFNLFSLTTESGCSRVYDEDGHASGACDIVFNSPGTYTVKLEFTDTDRTYRNAQGPVETINVA
ncbi:MAG TPA: hypothetical protein VHX62_17010 [Solirubrobacteraceae bacterium]|nr:hypothetical protein [Solirubrobacteraceae bacterium]